MQIEIGADLKQAQIEIGADLKQYQLKMVQFETK